MKKKYIGIALSALMLITVVTVGGTLAWLTDQDQAVNNVTVGNVQIEVEEPNWDEEDATDIWPGKVTAKDPIVTNTGKNPSYVRIKVVYDSAYANYLTFDYDTDSDGAWFEKDGYYYYKSVLGVDSQTSPLFNQFTFSSTYEEPQNGVNPAFAINVYAEAVQSQGFAPADTSEAAFRTAILAAFDAYNAQENGI